VQHQSPKSNTPNDLHSELAVVRQSRTRRLQALAGSAGLALYALFAIGCPGAADLENPNQQPAPGGGGTPTTSGGTASNGGSSGGAAAASCVTACFTKIVQMGTGLGTNCSFCHNNKPIASGGLKSSMLDLDSPGVEARLKNVPATHGDLTASDTPGDCTAGALLVDANNPDASWLLTKVTGKQKGCGTPMPTTGPLGAADLMCMQTFIACVAGKPLGGGSGGTSSGGTSGGGTSAGGASGGSGGASSGGSGGHGGSGGSGGSGGAKGGNGGSGGT
jgi:hypothetical protein